MSYLREAWEKYPQELAAQKRFHIPLLSDSSQYRFEGILVELAELREAKVAQYGETRYSETDPRRSKLLLYADLHRKFKRLEQYLFYEKGMGGPDSIEDTFKDLANYAAMGIQLMRKEGWK